MTLESLRTTGSKSFVESAEGFWEKSNHRSGKDFVFYVTKSGANVNEKKNIIVGYVHMDL